MTSTCAEQVIQALRGKEELQMRLKTDRASELKTAHEVLIEVLTEEHRATAEVQEEGAPPDARARQEVLVEIRDQWGRLFADRCFFEFWPWNGNNILDVEVVLQPDRDDKMRTRLEVRLIKRPTQHRDRPPRTVAEKVIIGVLGQLDWKPLGWRRITKRGARPKNCFELAKSFGELIAVISINPNSTDN